MSIVACPVSATIELANGEDAGILKRIKKGSRSTSTRSSLVMGTLKDTI